MSEKIRRVLWGRPSHNRKADRIENCMESAPQESVVPHIVTMTCLLYFSAPETNRLVKFIYEYTNAGSEMMKVTEDVKFLESKLTGDEVVETTIQTLERARLQRQ